MNNDIVHLKMHGGIKCICGIYPVTYSLCKDGAIVEQSPRLVSICNVEEIHLIHKEIDKMGTHMIEFCPHCLDDNNIAIAVLEQLNEETQDSSLAALSS
jgi:hypothetical protein